MSIQPARDFLRCDPAAGLLSPPIVCVVMDRTDTEVGKGAPRSGRGSGSEKGRADAWQARCERAEEKADQLYKLAEAAQAAIDVLRGKLAHAEGEIDRITRGCTAVA